MMNLLSLLQKQERPGLTARGAAWGGVHGNPDLRTRSGVQFNLDLGLL
jgi:hypothetical protein